MSFKVGDRVKIVNEGRTGVIKDLFRSWPVRYLVLRDALFKGEKGRYASVSEQNLEHIDPAQYALNEGFNDYMKAAGYDSKEKGEARGCAWCYSEGILEVVTPASNNKSNCPICKYPIQHCQCIFAGSAHPDREKRKSVVKDHLYLLSKDQLEHVLFLEKWWQTSYDDPEKRDILDELKEDGNG